MPSNDFKLTFTLKQHTPIIHFQYDQKGATLRATELKPKLDRFLIEKLGLHNTDGKPKNEFKSWFIAGQDGALDYKVRVDVVNGKTKNYLPLSLKLNTRQNQYREDNLKQVLNDIGIDFEYLYPVPFFANADKIKFRGNQVDLNKSKLDDIRFAIYDEGDIRVTITSFAKPLLQKIEQLFKVFLAQENFGTRQNKGFGSFYLKDEILKKFEQSLKDNSEHVFELSTKNTNWRSSLSIIDTFYKYLKSGQREDKRRGIPYDKSFIFQYICKEYGFGWEKKFLKNAFPEIIHGTHKPIVCQSNQNKEYKYIRALLGLAEHNEYRPNDGKKQIKIASEDKDSEGKPIYQRFKSPLTFKVFDGRIYVIYNESYSRILNKRFKFTLDTKSKTLDTPEAFDMYRFLQFVSTKVTNFKEVL